MSYDGWIRIETAEGERGWEGHEVAEIGNYTSNVSPMWRWALSLALEKDTGLGDLDGWSCSDAAPVLSAAAVAMQTNAARMQAMEPANGWGNHNGAQLYLERAAEVCGQFAHVPNAYLHWWR